MYVAFVVVDVDVASGVSFFDAATVVVVDATIVCYVAAVAVGFGDSATVVVVNDDATAVLVDVATVFLFLCCNC